VLKILIAEDDLMIADVAEMILVERGYEVCGIARTVDEAIALGRSQRPDLALIDLRLADGGFGTDIVAPLRALGKLGVLYATGNAAQVALTKADGDASLAKPYRSDELLRGMEIVAEIVATGAASPPFPRGFKLLPEAAAPGGSSHE
jgi:DNA-binding response OmpR family regulator